MGGRRVGRIVAAGILEEASGQLCLCVCSPAVSHGVVPRRQLSSQSPPACDKKVPLLVRWVWGSGSGSGVGPRLDGGVTPPRCRKRQEVLVATVARSHEEEEEAQAEAVAAPATCPQAGMVWCCVGPVVV